jgi:uncharacterized protein (TIGR03437 family)
MGCRLILLHVGICSLCLAQTTNVNLNLTVPTASATEQQAQRFQIVANLNAPGLPPFSVFLDISQPIDASGNVIGDLAGTASFVFNRLDSFTAPIDIPKGASNPVHGTIAGGTGAYKGASGSVNLTIQSPFPGSFAVAATGSVTAGGKTVTFNAPMSQPAAAPPNNTDFISGSGNGTLSPLGNVTVALKVDVDTITSTAPRAGTLKLSFNNTDSLSFYFQQLVQQNPPVTWSAVVVNGTGAYAGATGTANIIVNAAGANYSITGTGTITQRPAGVPVITQVSAAYGPDIVAQNTWLAIKGTNLVPANTPSTGVNWNNAPEFTQNPPVMPTQLQGISVSINGKPAYVNFFCSAATNPACASDQINVLSPLETSLVDLSVVVTNNGVPSAAFVVPAEPFEPSFLLLDTTGHIVAVHLDGTLVGPTTLYPGATTPAKAGETIVLFGIGFGLPTNTITPGSPTQSGALANSISCQLGLNSANVAAALISPGLYQFNVTIPANAISGDNLFYCTVRASNFGKDTPAGNLITVQ